MTGLYVLGYGRLPQTHETNKVFFQLCCMGGISVSQKMHLVLSGNGFDLFFLMTYTTKLGAY